MSKILAALYFCFVFLLLFYCAFVHRTILTDRKGERVAFSELRFGLPLRCFARDPRSSDVRRMLGADVKAHNRLKSEIKCLLFKEAAQRCTSG